MHDDKLQQLQIRRICTLTVRVFVFVQRGVGGAEVGAGGLSRHDGGGAAAARQARGRARRPEEGARD